MSEPNQWDEAWMNELERADWKEAADEWDAHVRHLDEDESDRLNRDKGENG